MFSYPYMGSRVYDWLHKEVSFHKTKSFLFPKKNYCLKIYAIIKSFIEFILTHIYGFTIVDITLHKTYTTKKEPKNEIY